MKTTLNNAIKLAQKIEMMYSQLNLENEGFFNLYHDDLRIQSDCAYQEVDDIEEYLAHPKKIWNGATSLELAEGCMKNLKDTLTYVTFIIDVQTKLNNCPKSIYG